MTMKIGASLLKHLTKKYEPSSLISFPFSRYDVVLKTDEEGNPVVVFIGKADEQGLIKGDRYARRMIKDANGAVMKDHWDYKGKV
jgi:hypothetical protein